MNTALPCKEHVEALLNYLTARWTYMWLIIRAMGEHLEQLFFANTNLQHSLMVKRQLLCWRCWHEHGTASWLKKHRNVAQKGNSGLAPRIQDPRHQGTEDREPGEGSRIQGGHRLLVATDHLDFWQLRDWKDVHCHTHGYCLAWSRCDVKRL